MNTTETTINVLRKLQLARVKLQGMELKKTGENKHIDYDYFELKDFLPQAQTIFCELGLCGIVSYSFEGCSLTIYNTEDFNEKIVFLSPWADAQLKGCSPVQNIGAAQTYQRRYLWVTALEIVEHDALDATTGSEGKEEMVMTNRLVPKHYWDATDPIAKAKIIGEGNGIKKSDEDKKWYITKPKEAAKADEPQPELPAAIPSGEIRWNGHVEKVTQKSTQAGTDYWEIELNDEDESVCYCKNKQLVEELQMMGGEEVSLTVQKNARKGTYELIDFEGALA